MVITIGTQGSKGIIAPGLRPDYKTYRSPYAPKYTIAPNYHGISPGRVFQFGRTAALFGGVLGIAGIFFVSDVPKVRKDILQKLPLVGEYFVKEIPPEDNPF